MNEQSNDTLIRQLVLEILMSVTTEEEFSHIAIRNVLNKYNYLPTKDKALIKRMTEGTLERMVTIDYCLNIYSKTKTDKMKPLILNLLRMGAYQILFMDGVYDTKAVNESVKLAQKRGFQGLKGYVNGVLRTLVREKEQIPYPKREDNEAEWLSVTYSMPMQQIILWLAQYDVDTVQTIVEASLAERPVCIRMDENLSESGQEELLRQMKEQGVIATKHSFFNYAYVLNSTDNVRELPGFREGKIVVQDASSMLVATVAAPKQNDIIMDVCAAPGGKTLHLAAKLNNTGRIVARDVSEYKLQFIRENADKSSYSNITCEVFDATELDEESVGKYDIVIADLPCSGLSVMARKSDIRYRFQTDKMKELVQLQQSILSTVQSYVKPGGILIFSTCTINKEENEQNAEWFASNFPFNCESFASSLPEELQNEEHNGMLQILPGEHECDGFFISKFRRK